MKSHIHKIVSIKTVLIEFLIFTGIGVIVFIGWWTNDRWETTDTLKADRQNLDSLKISKSKPELKKTIRDYISNHRFIHWAPNHPDTTGYMCQITLGKISALYWYHGQCQVDYLTYLTSDTTIDVLWSYRTDCILNMDFLEKSNGIEKYPKCGDIFATLTLINDTTLKVKYNFPEWAKKVNEIVKDSLFPTYYYLKTDN